MHIIQIIESAALIIAAIFESMALFIATAVAVWGINSWQREMKGKKEYELAEEVLASFYEARNKINAIRNPFSFNDEGKSRRRGENENKEESRALDQAYVVYERYLRHQDTFNKLYALRYRFMAIYGKDKGKPFIELDKTVKIIMGAAHMLGFYWVKQTEKYIQRSERELEEQHKNILKNEKVIWAGFDDGPINPKIEEVIRDIENICEPILKQR